MYHNKMLCKLFFVFIMLFGLAVFAGEIEKEVTFDINTLSFTKIEDYDFVKLEGCNSASGKIGAPSLPRASFSLLIPGGAKIRDIKVVSADTTTIEGEYTLYPVQYPRPFMRDRIPPVVEPDKSIYSQSSAYPEEIIANPHTGSMSGYRLTSVSVCPLQYVPAEKKLIFYSRIRFKVTYENEFRSLQMRTRRQNEIFRERIEKLILNPEDIYMMEPSIGLSSSRALPADTVEYVIITADSFATAFKVLAEWKIKKGIPTEVVSTEYIYSNYSGVDNAEKVRNFIKDANSSWGTIWVLLGGQCDYEWGQEIVPRRDVWYMDTDTFGFQFPDEDTIPSDLYFSDLDGDWNADGDNTFGEAEDSVDFYSDVFVGRAPVRTVSQVEVFVHKTLTYEKSPPPGYQKKILLPAAFLWPGLYDETLSQEAIANIIPSGWRVSKLYERNGNLAHEAFIDSVQSGYGFAHLVGHGSESAIYAFIADTPYFSSEDLDTLGNGNLLGVHNSIACMNGALDYVPNGDCFAEHYLTSNTGGGFSIMNSRYGWGTPPDMGPTEHIDTCFYHELFKEDYTFHNRIGAAHASSKDGYVSQINLNEVTIWPYCIYESNLYGDPELSLWTDIPHTLTVTHNPVILTGETRFSVDVTDEGIAVEDALVCLYKLGEVYVRGRTDATGHVTLNFASPPSSTGIMYCTVTRHNYLPFEGTVSVVSDGDAYVLFNEYRIMDPAGNNDGNVDPRERVEMSLILKNEGNLDALNVRASLSTDDPYVTIIDALKDFGDIPANEVVQSSGNYVFEVDYNCPANHVINFGLVARDINGTAWQSYFSVPITTPDISLSHYNYDFETVFIGYPDTFEFLINNEGRDTLFVNDIVSNNSVFGVDINSVDVPPAESRPVNLTFSPTEEIRYEGEILVHSDDVVEPTKKLLVKGIGLYPPDISIFPLSISQRLLSGETATSNLNIQNTGLSDLYTDISILPRKDSLGEDLEEVIGNWWGGQWKHQLFDCGNIYSVDSAVTITELKAYLAIEKPTQLYFFVYEADSLEGEYEKIKEVCISQTDTGEGWYSTGPIGVDMREGKYYYIGNSWKDSTWFGVYDSYPPFTVSFGRLETGVYGYDSLAENIAGYPPAASFNYDYVKTMPVYHQAIVTGEGVGWLSANSYTDTIPAGTGIEVGLTFDANRLLTGTYTADVVVNSNDPDEPAVTARADLYVTGIPDISVSDDTLDYGTVFLGYSYTDTLIVANRGTEDLSVYNIYFNNSDYSVSRRSFTLEPEEAETLVVTFRARNLGASTGTLRIMSNDPDNRFLPVRLRAEVIRPPDISVSPSHLSDSLHTGETATHTFTIYNSGESDLDYGVIIDGEDEAADLKILIMQTYMSLDDIQSLLLEFPSISVLDVYNGRDDELLTLDSLLHYDCVITSHAGDFINHIAVGDLLADYVDAGGGLILTIASFVNYYELRGRIKDDGYMPFNLGSNSNDSANLGNFDAFHPIMEKVKEMWARGMADMTISDGSELIGEWDKGYPLVAIKGSNVVGVNIYLSDSSLVERNGRRFYYPYWTGDVAQMLYNAALFSSGSNWLTCENTSGSIPPGENRIVEVEFKPDKLGDGDYSADIVVLSNDPDEKEIRISCDLHVEGAPDIAVSTDLLNYGLVFPGHFAFDTLVVSNTGAEPLIVSSITSNNPDFTVYTTNFTLNPGEYQDVIVSFVRGTVGPSLGELSIQSNDPDESYVIVNLRGECVQPPEIAVSPEFLRDSLYTNETSTHQLTIHNNGGSNLDFNILAIETVGGLSSITPTTGRLSFGNEKLNADDELEVTLSDKGEILKSFPAPASGAVGLTWAKEYLWALCNDRGDTLYKLNPTNGSIVKKVALEKSGFYSDLTWDGSAFWITEPNTDDIYKYDTLGNILTSFPTPYVVGISIAWDGEYLWSVDNNWEHIYKVDPNTGAYSDSIPMLVERDFGLAWDGSYFWTNSMETAKTYKIDPSDGSLLDSLNTPPGPGSNNGTGIAFDGRYLWIYNRDNSMIYQVDFEFVPSVSWLKIDPEQGTVPAGSSTVVDVTFDATGLNGGDYFANVIVESNDPVNSEVSVPASLHVTGTPVIVAAPDNLDFGIVYPGYSYTKTFVVYNVGSEMLVVSHISSDNPDFVPDIRDFRINPGEFQEITVTFTPSTGGSINGNLRIDSNNHEDPNMIIPMSAESRTAPDIAIEPDSISLTLLTGEWAFRFIRVENNGGSDLIVDITALERLRSLADPFWDFATSTADIQSYKTMTLDAAGLPSVESNSESTKEEPKIVLSATTGTGNIVNSFPAPRQGYIGLTWVKGYLWAVSPHTDLLYKMDPTDGTILKEVQLERGHYTGLDWDGDAFWIADPNSDDINRVDTFGNFLRTFDASAIGCIDIAWDGKYLWDSDFVSGRTCKVDPATGGLLDSLWFPDCRVGGMAYDGVCIWENGRDSARTYRINPHNKTLVGYIETPGIVGPNNGSGVEFDGEHLWIANYDDTTIYQVEFEYSIPWLRVNRTSLVIPPDSFTYIRALFMAPQSDTGDYFADIVFSSNDPDEPVLMAPVHLEVISAPEISLDPDTLFFENAFVGIPSIDTLSVANNGTDTLEVSNIRCRHRDYTVDTTMFTLLPGDTQKVVVTFTPSSLGPNISYLRIFNNDQDERYRRVRLFGNAVYPPDIAVSPSFLRDTLRRGETSEHTLKIHNTGLSNLIFNINIGEILPDSLFTPSISVADASLSSNFEYIELSKGEEDPRVGTPVLSGVGGPDPSGYFWVDSDEKDGCEFDWTDISSTGTPVTGLSDDSYVGPFPIDFEFPFYGDEYTEFYISSNGYIGFGTPTDFNSLNNQPIPTTQTPNNIIAWCWDDLYPNGEVYYQNFTDRLVIQFVDYGEYNGSGSINAEVIVYASGHVLIQYLNTSGDFDISSNTIGMEGPAGTEGIQVAFNTDYIHDNLAIRFSKIPQWLSVDISADTILPDDSLEVTFTFDATDLDFGNHHTDIIISCNDPDESEAVIPADLYCRFGYRISADDKKIPKVFFIDQNHPNPFNTHTAIKYGCPEDSKVCIRVFDVMGREVNTLINKNVEAGYHEVKWNGRDKNGKELSNAVYFYRIDTDKDFEETKKMIFLR